ncbi:zinc-dependent metalloprotease [Solitalea sp. MAHUQ-68]|uniref:Zinc-dependent metalloprotease n=1 Tax=Solitalea agri TaxID=2953739 RepID=A0A9X2F311_9SPHI|nr:zinc-dependent metalloprotease [Solitalea agri]MCO4293310.1 zinc-dependent metalloprotease [Solitalea agri]
MIKFSTKRTLIGTVLLASALTLPAMAQQKTNMPNGMNGNNPSMMQSQPKQGIKPYSEVITAKAISDKGLFTVHKVDDRYFYEIPDSLMNRDLLLVTRTSKTANGLGYGGEQLDSKVLRFEKYEHKKVFLREISYDIVVDKNSEMYQSVQNSNVQPIIASFDIKSLGKDSTGVVVDVTDLFSRDNPAFTFPEDLRKKYRIAGADDSRSYISSVKSYPLNIEVKNVFTYRINGASPDASGSIATVEINNSMLLLPKEPMKPRYFDNRVGYFAQTQVDFSAEEQQAGKTTFIRRWRLEPKDLEAYNRGELVEPKKQIVYYIDPATPAKWRPYLIAGVNDWNKAFEQAGFKNAIICKEAPTAAEDPEFSTEDARYSVIRYFASEIPNAYGPHVADPRSGEIIESHIGWYHNVMKLVRNWFFIQTSAVNPDSRNLKFKDEVMGQLIRFVSSHEVGHTLGLRHNYGSSFAYPVDSLRSAAFTQKMGTAPSIMDYARFNYVAQPEDKGVNLYPAIGVYDKYAIDWGYRTLPDAKTPKEEELVLNKMIVKHSGDPLYFFGTETNPADPRSQNEDLGNDAVKASTYGIKNLKRELPNLNKWTYEEGKDYGVLKDMYSELTNQWNRYMGHVAKNIGGVYETPKSYDQQGDVYAPVSKEMQKKAVAFLNEQALATPTWLIDQSILRKFDQSNVVDRIRAFQTNILNSIFSVEKLSRLIEFETTNPTTSYSVSELFKDVRGGVWTELAMGKNIDTYRRNLQRAYVERLATLLTPPANQDNVPPSQRRPDQTQTDIRPLAKTELKVLQAQILAATPKYSGINRAHLEDLSQRIKDILNPKS